jgi:hypothetical protein
MSVSMLRVTAHLLHKGLPGIMRLREWARRAHENCASRKENHRGGRLWGTIDKGTAEFICKTLHGVCQEFAGHQESVESALASSRAGVLLCNVNDTRISM